MDQENKSSLAKSVTPSKSNNLDNLEKPSIEKSPITFSSNKSKKKKKKEKKFPF